MSSRLRPYLTNGRQSDQSIFQVAQTSAADYIGGAHRVGTRGVLEDGRVFYYARSTGAAIVAGNWLIMPVQDTDWDDIDIATDLGGQTTVTPTQGGSATAVAGEFVGGTVCINAGTAGSGPGIILTIAEHAAWGATTALPLTLDGPLPVTLNADVKCTVTKNPWADVVIQPTGQDQFCCGVAPIAVAAGTTNPQWFWCQTWGVASAEHDLTTAVGSCVMAGDTTTGQAQVLDGYFEQRTGQSLWTVTTAADSYATFLTIAP